jgi:hypothetical protein
MTTFSEQKLAAYGNGKRVSPADTLPSQAQEAYDV